MFVKFSLQDIEYIESVYDKLFKLVERGNDKKLKPEFDCVCKVQKLLKDEKKHVRFADWDAKEVSFTEVIICGDWGK